MSPFFTRVLALAHKESLHLIRDRQALGLAMWMPLLLVLLFGYAVSFDVEIVRIAVIDRDKTPESRDLISALQRSSAFEVEWLLDDENQVEALFRAGKVKAAAVVPAGFAKDQKRGDPTSLQFLIDGADGTSAGVTLGYSLAVAQNYALNKLSDKPILPLDARVRTWFNPQMESELFVVPGLVGMVLAIMAVLLSALTVAREWERGSMEQLFATPVGRLPVVLGKLLPYVALGLLQLLLVLTAGVWLFDVPIRGDFLLLVGSTALFLICVLGQGFLISTITKSQQVATQIGALSAILPSTLLSGFLFPIKNMPPPLQVISQIVPARYLLPILRGVMLQGRGIAELWPNILGLVVLSLAVVTACTLKFRRRLD